LALKTLHGKYNVTKVEGDTDPNAQYFVMRIDTDMHAQLAVMHYALLMEGIGEVEFAEQLRDWVLQYWGERQNGKDSNHGDRS
jgi:hypothetical protein